LKVNKGSKLTYAVACSDILCGQVRAREWNLVSNV
jgi:hypothetical protein